MSTFAQALSLAQSGDLAGAESILIALTKRERQNADAFHLLANILHAKGDIAAALVHFQTAARLAPNDSVVAFNHAAVLAAVGRHAEAADSYARALTLRPGDAEALFARGASLAAVQNYAEAVECYAAARAAGMTSNPALYANRGAALAALGRHEEAVAACERALAANPEDVSANFNRGASLLALDRSEAAIEALDRALALAPDHVLARANRAPALANLGRFDEAMADVGFALDRQPGRVDHLKRLAFVLSVADRHAEALAVFDQILAATPDDLEAAYGKADAMLSAGDFAGLASYETRLLGKKPLVGPPSDAPVWSGAESLEGKTILVQGEQGFGDLFQFCRFIPTLAARGATVTLQERAQTVALMRSLEGLCETVGITAPPPRTDYRIPLCSLMQALNVTLETIPAPIPYLHAEPERVERWRQRLAPTQRRRIGVCWSGLNLQAQQRKRRLDGVALARLLAAPADFVSLQFDAGDEAPLLAAHNVQAFGADTKDFAELAALIETLDLVITVDTNVAHLAGALGKPLWILLPFSPDWRWLRGRDDTPWYPQARLFRQTRWGDWRDVIDRVLTALQ